jgi:hypothetical protein
MVNIIFKKMKFLCITMLVIHLSISNATDELDRKLELANGYNLIRRYLTQLLGYRMIAPDTKSYFYTHYDYLSKPLVEGLTFPPHT